jgi:hypothetical protein
MFVKTVACAACAAMTLGVAPAFADGAKTYAQTFNTFTPGNPAAILPSAAELRRSAAGVDLSGRLSGLTPNSAYSAWWVIFNSPGRCTVPCGMDDVMSGVGQVFNATGYLSGAGGVANVTAHLDRGPIPAGVDRRSNTAPALNPAFEVGLRQPITSEIHLVIARLHGPMIAGRVAEQTTGFLGGCDVFACADQQFVVFPPITLD